MITKSTVFDNILTNADLKDQLTNAFDVVADILVDHCGPFATNCVIGSRYRQVNDVDEFTKDGINILNHLIVSSDAALRFAVRMTRFVGIVVDKRCHDGTTTSMLLFCRLAKLAVSKMDLGLTNKDRYNWFKELSEALAFYIEKIEALRITEDDVFARCQEFGIETTASAVRGAIAYHMAMISSKGDHDLSEKVSLLIQSSPKKIPGIFENVRLAVETPEAYTLKRQEYDLLLNANLGDTRHYNHKSDTQYLSEDAVIFATGNQIVSHSMEAAFLQAFISTEPALRAELFAYNNIEGWEAYHENKRNLIIMAPVISDHKLLETILAFNMENPTFKISVFTVQARDRMISSLFKTLHFVSGSSLFSDVMMTDPLSAFIGLGTNRVKAHLIGHKLALYNLYEKDDEFYHPFYRDPEMFEPYTRFRIETEDLIEFAKKNVTNPALDNEELSNLITLYRALTCQIIYDIEVGGSTHDQYANRTVYEDTMGAAISAIEEGIVLGGYGNLAKLGYMEAEDGPYNRNSLKTGIAQIIDSVVEDSLRIEESDRVLPADLTEWDDESKWSALVADMNCVRNGTNYLVRFTLDKDMLEAFLKKTPDRPFLLQAYGGYNEQFKRFVDILPRLANSTHMADMRVDPNTNVQ